ncbi:MAG: metal-dependent transcriptional regulator [Candidatus Hodarchaeota archaeon]
MHLSKAEIEVLQFLFDHSGSIRVGELKKNLKKPHSTLNSIIHRLERNGLVIWQKYGPVTLTETGKNKAAHLSRHHFMLEILLVEALGMSAQDAHQEALTTGSTLTCQVIDRIAQKYDPSYSACGKKIPNSRECS